MVVFPLTNLKLLEGGFLRLSRVKNKTASLWRPRATPAFVLWEVNLENYIEEAKRTNDPSQGLTRKITWAAEANLDTLDENNASV